MMTVYGLYEVRMMGQTPVLSLYEEYPTLAIVKAVVADFCRGKVAEYERWVIQPIHKQERAIIQVGSVFPREPMQLEKVEY